MKNTLYALSGLLIFSGTLFGLVDTFPLISVFIVVVGFLGLIIAYDYREGESK
jgi:hypothetical protein